MLNGLLERHSINLPNSAVGQHHPALGQQTQWKRLDPGKDRVQPLHPLRRVNRGGHVVAAEEVEPADLGLRGQVEGLLLGGIPARVHPAGQAGFDQRPEHRIEDGNSHASFQSQPSGSPSITSTPLPASSSRSASERAKSLSARAALRWPRIASISPSAMAVDFGRMRRSVR